MHFSTEESTELLAIVVHNALEPAEVFERCAEQGIFGQLTLHSHTSQYGQLRALLADNNDTLREHFTRVLHDDILSGAFAREWSYVQTQRPNRLEQLRARAITNPLAEVESALLMRESGKEHKL
jgi:ketol-acid reductoisomerase